MSNPTCNKVVIIGLDGATFSLIMPWIKGGKLPVLSKLIQEGAWGNLRSTFPNSTAPAWSSFITGKNPGNHGIFDFRYHKGDGYSTGFISSLCRRGKSIWKFLSEQEKKVCIFNVPITYPPEEVNGFMISGLPAPEVNEKIFYPQDLCNEVISKVGMFAMKPFPIDHLRLSRFDRIFKEMDTVVDQHFKVANYLFQNKEWDFFCMVFGTTDHVQHNFWHCMDPNHPFHNPSQGALYGECIFRIYKKIDRLIGTLIEGLDDNTTVIVLSDHGAGANGNKAFYLNNWLAQEGFLTYKSNSTTNTNKTGLLKYSIFLAKKYIPRKYKNRIKYMFPWLKFKGEVIYSNPDIDWSRTKAFSYDKNGLIWINLKDREPEGVVNDGKEYEDLRSEIIKRALDFTDPESGKKVFSEALRKEEIYYGEELGLAPDVVLIQKERKYTYPHRNSNLSRNRLPIETLTEEEIKKNPLQMGSHRREGILIVKGSPVLSGKNIIGARIIDIAPTVLYLMGVPVPEDMDGRVITEAINPSYLDSNPISYSKTDKSFTPVRRQDEYTRSEEKQVEEMLKSLGYLD